VLNPSGVIQIKVKSNQNQKSKGVACKSILVCTLTHILDHTSCRGSRKTSEFPAQENSNAFVITEMEYQRQLAISLLGM